MAKSPAPKANKDPKATPETDTETEATAQAEARKAAKKRTLLLVAAVAGGLILGGGGVAAFFMTRPNSQAVKTAAPAVEKKAPAPLTLAFVNVPNVTAPIIDNGKVLGYVLLSFSLEVSPGPDEADVFQHLPALQAAFLADVSQNPIGTLEDRTVIDYQGLETRLLEVANREMKGGTIKRVLITQTIHQ